MLRPHGYRAVHLAAPPAVVLSQMLDALIAKSALRTDSCVLELGGGTVAELCREIAAMLSSCRRSRYYISYIRVDRCGSKLKFAVQKFPEGRAVARQTIRYRYWLPAPQCR
jgi:hypothetical protein